MFSIGSYQQADTGATGWVLYALLVLVVLALIVWWLFRRVKAMEVEALSEAPAEPVKQKGEDDLKQIEGIGPKVEKILKEAGITNFESLSKADPSEIQTVLKDAGLQMMNPEGWIEQAQLAAQGDWDELQKLQDELKGGRKK